MGNLSNIFIGLCLIICFALTARSYSNARQHIVDNGAQHVVTLGVLFTFLGIAVGLWNFNTNTADMIANINVFLDGMKTAFWTSIIGMTFGLVIKIFIQAGVERSENDFVRQKFSAVDDTSKEILAALKANDMSDTSKEILAALKASDMSDTSKEILAALKANDMSDTSKEILAALKASDMSDTSKQILAALKANDMSELNELAGALKNFVPAVRELSAQLKSQTETFDAMKNHLARMEESLAASEKKSAELLTATKNFQAQSLANDDEQRKVLSDNTAQIVAMKTSFDEFLRELSDKFSDSIIDALNRTIQDFNKNLTQQFGDNFKQLNAAVRELVNWQREYKEIITATTDELKAINATFNGDTLGKLQGALASFAATSAKNISVQQNLSAANERVIKSIAQMQTVTENFGKFSESALKANADLLKGHLDATSQLAKDFSDGNQTLLKNHFNEILQSAKTFSDANATVLKGHLDDISQLAENFKREVVKVNKVAEAVALDTKQYMNNFNSTSKMSMEQIGKAIENFKKGLNDETGKSLQTLAGSLAKISEQMIGNYNTLVARIAALDALLAAERRQSK